MSHPKPPNLPSFWPLTPERERKVRLNCAWSHFVGLIEFYLLEPFGKLPSMNSIYNQPKTSKLWICPFILLLMKRVYLSLNAPITSPQYQLPVPNLSGQPPLPALSSKSQPSVPARSSKWEKTQTNLFPNSSPSSKFQHTVPDTAW